MDRLGCTDLLDPYQNVTVGIGLFGDLLSTGKGVEWALMAYNGGSVYADKKVAQGILTEYARNVLETVKNLESVKHYV
jgi:soluble lytic murein transglycosylase-like protein